MSNSKNEPTNVSCLIQVAGHLDPERIEWFGGLTGTTGYAANGAPVTWLAGELPDQAALFGLLNRVRDLGLKLISVAANSKPLDLE